MNENYLIETYAHEIGHYIDAKTAKKKKRFSKEKEWKTAMSLDFEVSKKKSPTQYGTNDESEDFAESFSEYAKNSVSFAKMFPNRAKIIENILGQ